jgi:hypothetical protein
MREAIVFLLKVSIKYGILIFGAAWLLAVGSQCIFVKGDKTKNIKNRIYIGISILIVGMIFTLIPIK